MTESLKDRIYRLLVNRIPGIRARYLDLRRESSGAAGRLRCFAALAWWNLSYYLLGRKKLRCPVKYGYYERKRQVLTEPEGAEPEEPEKLIERLERYDIISFDIFDTLLLRPFSDPTELFYLLDIRFSYIDLCRIRREAEAAVRKKSGRAYSGEVSLSEIWAELERVTGIPAEEGMEAELELERKYCTANPYFLPILEALRKRKKKIVVTSDMYLGRDFLKKLLEEKGLGAFDGYYVSSEHRASKHEGGLYRIVREETGGQDSAAGYVHVGDNVHSDIRMAGKAGFAALLYPNPQKSGNPYRPMDMSPMTGAMYRGIVNIRFHAERKKYNSFYKYGYIYGGILALGYCQFIHRYVKERKIDRIWFLARDGEILKKVYDLLYPEEDTAYVLWSRNVSARLLSDVYRYDFFQRFLFQKINQGYSMERIFSSMGLGDLLEEACRELNCGRKERLTEDLARRCRDHLVSVWGSVSSIYEEERQAAGRYLKKLADGCSSAAAVDIGWAGSGAAALDRMMEQILHIPFRVYGLAAGTNTAHNLSPDASEGFFFSGRMESYLFSQQKNRDLWKFHDLNRKHNLYMELLFTSPSPSLKGFGTGEDKETVFRFGRKEGHENEIRQIQEGIMDYVRDYRRFFGEFLSDGIGEISGRDAYAPLLLFLGDRRAQRELEASFHWDTDQNVE